MRLIALPAVILGEGKSLIPKPGAERAPESWQTTFLVETTKTMVWVNDALQPWTTNHLVEVTQTMIPEIRRYLAVMRSPIAEPDRCGDTVTITALSREPDSPRLSDNLCIFKKVYGKYRS